MCGQLTWIPAELQTVPNKPTFKTPAWRTHICLNTPSRLQTTKEANKNLVTRVWCCGKTAQVALREAPGKAEDGPAGPGALTPALT